MQKNREIPRNRQVAQVSPSLTQPKESLQGSLLPGFSIGVHFAFYQINRHNTSTTFHKFLVETIRILPGQGVIPLDDICRRLQKLGYNGDCSVELFRPEYWEWNPNELAVQVRNSAMKVLSPYSEVE